MRRIVDAAVTLAEKGGFEAVRLRDVAEQSEVALGTLYKYFRSKEDLLLFAFHEETRRLEASVALQPLSGRIPRTRAVELFRRMTEGLIRRPQLARALVRAMATADAASGIPSPDLHRRMTRLIVAALRGEPIDPSARCEEDEPPSREGAQAKVLLNVWFSSLVGWSCGIQTADEITDNVRSAAELMLS
jgi:AcrR family transcriptional regulator